ncbi:hypothetical protein J4219_04895 [Candidatus Woesearchaeota archaeon]|nr:hypothetical protein [Candidatus Woesearchaeota archaeon]
MKKPCASCGKEFESDAEWKSVCKACFARNAQQQRDSVTIGVKGNELSTSEVILRQVCLKIASEQLSRAKPTELIVYARELRQRWNEW